MSRISYSQFSKWDKCPYTWKLDYVDKAETFVGNIYTLFGTAIHETIQAYLVAYYGKTIKYADSLPLHDILQYRMEENYKKSKEQHGDDFDVSLEDMKSFFQDGINIIDEFLKRKSSHFPKKNTELSVVTELNESPTTIPKVKVEDPDKSKDFAVNYISPDSQEGS